MVSNNNSSSSSGSSRTVSAGSLTYPRVPDVLELRVVRHPRAHNRARRHMKNPNNEPNHMYECSLCPEKFATYQALGGHQNAHRRERLLEKCIMQYRQGVIENVEQQTLSNSSMSNPNAIYSPNPIRVFYPPSIEFRNFAPYSQPPLSFGPNMNPRPSFDRPTRSWSTYFSHAGSGSRSGSRSASASDALPRWMPYRRPNSTPSAAIPTHRPNYERPEPTFPLGFGAYYQHGSSSIAPMNIDRKVNIIIEEVDEEKEGKETWGRDLKLWF